MIGDELKSVSQQVNLMIERMHVDLDTKRSAWCDAHDAKHDASDEQLRLACKRQDRYCELMAENNRILEDVAHSLRVLSGRQRADG